MNLRSPDVKIGNPIIETFVFNTSLRPEVDVLFLFSDGNPKSSQFHIQQIFGLKIASTKKRFFLRMTQKSGKFPNTVENDPKKLDMNQKLRMNRHNFRYIFKKYRKMFQI